MRRIADRTSTQVRPRRQVEPDHRAQPRENYDSGSPNKRPFDPRQLGSRDARLLGHHLQAESMRASSEPDFGTDPAQHLQTALGATIDCPLLRGHRGGSWRATITVQLPVAQLPSCIPCTAIASAATNHPNSPRLGALGRRALLHMQGPVKERRSFASTASVRSAVATVCNTGPRYVGSGGRWLHHRQRHVNARGTARTPQGHATGAAQNQKRPSGFRRPLWQIPWGNLGLFQVVLELP